MQHKFNKESDKFSSGKKRYDQTLRSYREESGKKYLKKMNAEYNRNLYASNRKGTATSRTDTNKSMPSVKHSCEDNTSPNRNTSNSKITTNKRAVSTENQRSNNNTFSAGNTALRKTSQNKSMISTRQNTANNTTKAKKPYTRNRQTVKVTFLGGLNEIGKNITMFECGNDAFLLDCGMAFPDSDMMGIDYVIPDFTYLEKNKEKIKAIILTHGHEDHIGSIPFFLRKMNVPICGTALTLGLVKHKLEEYNLLRSTKFYEVSAGKKVKLGCMEIEFIHVNHSIPDAVGVAIHTPVGTLVHTGDFKIDFTPANNKTTDLNTFARLGDRGVLALFADSTNAELSGFTTTEQKVKDTFVDLFSDNKDKRIVVASFASNIDRIQQIMECAIQFGRKVTFSGRSMLNYVNTAQELGYLKIPEGVIIDLTAINSYPSEETLLVTTGSQGEPMSSLSRMANSEHKNISLTENDIVIISARPIPGNEKAIGSVIDELLKKGCKVVYESMYEIHVSGHARQEELKLLQSLVKPKFFVPVHGEQKHLRKHAMLAKNMGVPEKNIFIEDIGSVLEFTPYSVKRLAPVEAGQVFVDGTGVGDVGNIVLKDRRLLGESGIIIVVVVMDKETGKVTSGPDIVSRGFVYVKENEALMKEATSAVKSILSTCYRNGVRNWNDIKQQVKDKLSKMFFTKTKRTPVILPIIMMDSRES